MTSLGYKAGARGESSIAVGNNATSSRMGAYTLSFGTNSTSIKDNSIALGHDSVAGGYTKGNINELIGLLEKFETNPTDDNALIKAQKDMELARQTMKANASAENKFHYASAKAGVERIQLMIERLKNDLSRLSVTDSDTTNSIALGNQASARNKSAIAMGDNTESLGEYAFAATSGSKAYGNGSIALGHNATAGVLDSLITSYQNAHDDYISSLNSYKEVLKELNAAEKKPQSDFIQNINNLLKGVTDAQKKKLEEKEIRERDFYDMDKVLTKMNVTDSELIDLVNSAKNEVNKTMEILNPIRADYKTKIETGEKSPR